MIKKMISWILVIWYKNVNNSELSLFLLASASCDLSTDFKACE